MTLQQIPLEDEVGDVLEKALNQQQLSEAALAERAQVSLGKIRDAIDYRAEFTDDELRRLAVALDLNQLGLLALARGRYPLPEISGLPFCVYPLRTPHGIGVANAYLVGECGRDRAILFDTGADYRELRQAWPRALRTLEAVFLTHQETEHSGALEALLRDYPGTPVFGPLADTTGRFKLSALGDGSRLQFGRFEVAALQTPGHSEAHNCYVVRVPTLAGATPLLVSGDMLFAASVGGAFFCRERFKASLRRLLTELPESTVIAPGHGPLTTIQNERRFNPFVHW